MKRTIILISVMMILIVGVLTLTACDLFGGGDNDNIHTKSYEAITGKFVLYEAADKRTQYSDVYFDIDGSKGNFTLKYYENGVLKKEGVFQKIVTREEYIGEWKDNLHFNIKCEDSYEHIGAYTESLDPIDQFRIIEEFTGADKKYYLSELPFVMGTYVREGKEYKKEAAIPQDKDRVTPTLASFNTALDGIFMLDSDHYFYFVSPRAQSATGAFMSYFQYFSPDLDKPLEGFAEGRTYVNTDNLSRINFTYSREVLLDKSLQDTANGIVFGYHTFPNDRMVDHWGTVDFGNGDLTSFSFEHLSRNWTDDEWDEYTKNIEYHLPDAIIYEYVGGTYNKVFNQQRGENG